MEVNKKVNLYLIGLTAMTLTAFAASTVGTLAWFAYSTRATVSYQGASIRKTEQLQIGIVDDGNFIDEDEASEFKLTRESRDGHSIVWAVAGSGFTNAAILAYLNNSSYASNELPPVTTRPGQSTDPLALYDSPTAGHPLNTTTATYDEYVKLPFVLRIIDNNHMYVQNEKIWITDAVARTNGDKNIHKAVRAYFENTQNNFLLNPSSEEESADSRETVMAGLLDLNGDGYYDYDITTMKEIVYGDYTGTLTHSSTALAADSDFDNVNGIDHSAYIHNDDNGHTLATTFYAKHKEGVYTANYGSLTYSKGHYETLSTIRPNDVGNGYFTGGLEVGLTASDANALSYLDVTIFIEGWDHVIIDQAISHQFSLGLTFEINRV